MPSTTAYSNSALRISYANAASSATCGCIVSATLSQPSALRIIFSCSGPSFHTVGSFFHMRETAFCLRRDRLDGLLPAAHGETRRVGHEAGRKSESEEQGSDEGLRRVEGAERLLDSGRHRQPQQGNPASSRL